MRHTPQWMGPRWRPAGNQHEAVAPNGALILGFFLKPTASPTARNSSPRLGSASRHSGLMPASATTLAHLALSLRMN